ncbi:Hsp20/alpha crystallin family protein [Streptomyces sp. NPDC002643]
MTLPVRYRPGGLLERAFREPMASEFDELFDRMSRFLEAAAPSLSETSAWAPLADLRETDEAFVIECELPGLKREDIDVEIGDRELSITGQFKEREREGVLRRATRRSGRFEYRALLPSEAKAENVRASLTDGVLTVTIPKAQASKPRHVEITD